ncbi:MAG TPA: tautomerase family protein, partial [Polyangiaceae bacterium]|nr:tautomerase family protein [Polyangiaceae bacterium]
MPLVEIYVSEQRSGAERKQLADAVHRALVETIGIPVDDRFQIVRALAREDYIADANYFDLARSDDFLVVRVTLRRGRSPDKKQALYRAIADGAARAVGMHREDVLVVLHENDAIDWSF